MENWKDVTGYEGVYQVSDRGRVRRMGSTECLKPNINRDGYARVDLCRYGVKRTIDVQTLVLTAFVGPRPEGMECCHFPDSDPANNRLENLRWDTHVANIMDARILLARKGRTFGRPPGLSWDAVKAIRASDERPKVMAELYGVTPHYINRIKAGTERTISAGSVLVRMAATA